MASMTASPVTVAERPPRLGVRSAGFTFVEVAFTVAVAAMLLAAFLSVLTYSQQVFEQQMLVRAVEQMGRAAVERLSDQLRTADPATVLPTSMNSSNYVEFRPVTGYSGTTKQLGPVTRLAFEAAAGETINGADDNRDGRADEGVVAYSEDGAKLYELAGDVVGLRFTSQTGGISFEIDVAVTDARDNLIRETFARTVTFRN